MKFMKILKFVGIGILAMLVIGAVGLFLWSATSTYPAHEVALASLESTDKVTVSQDKWIAFTPKQKADNGFSSIPAAW